MKKLFKNLHNTFKIWNSVKKHPTMFSVVNDIYEFVNKVHKEQRPLVTKIVLLNMADGTLIDDFVSLWAGIGDCSPIERAKQLKAQNIELKRLLELAKNGTLTNEDKELIELTLQIFD